MTDFPKGQDVVRPLYKKTAEGDVIEKHHDANQKHQNNIQKNEIIKTHENFKGYHTTTASATAARPLAARQHSIKNIIEISRNNTRRPHQRNKRRRRSSATNSILPFDGVIIPKLQDTTQQILIRSGYKWCSYLQSNANSNANPNPNSNINMMMDDPDNFHEINFRDNEQQRASIKSNYQNNLEININSGDINNVTELIQQQNSKNFDYIDDSLGFQTPSSQTTNIQSKGNNHNQNITIKSQQQPPQEQLKQTTHAPITTILSSASLITAANATINTNNFNSNISAMTSPLKPPRHIKPRKKTRNLSCPVNLTNHQNFLNNELSFRTAILNKDNIYNLDNSNTTTNTNTTITNNNNLLRNNDHNNITIDNEFTKSYRTKFVSIGIQASPLPPYRLRVLPKCPQISSRSSIPDDKSTSVGDDEKVVNPPSNGCLLCFGARSCGQCIGRVIMSQCGLSLALFTWALLGAAAFYYTEGPFELEQSQKLKTLQNDLVIGLATDLRHVNNYEPVWLETIKKYIVKHETLLLEGVSSGYGEGGGQGGQIWSYPGCILFAISLLTTLGFGAPVPRTTLGRTSAVIFSAIGIPLHFLLVLNIGMVLARRLQRWVSTCSTPTTCGVLEKHTSKRHTFDLNTKLPKWINWFPFIAAILYYIFGILIFGVTRQRKFESFLFPLDFTATGGVALQAGYMRIIYGLYLEGAVILGGTAVSLLQSSATGKLTDIGLKLGLLTNS